MVHNVQIRIRHDNNLSGAYHEDIAEEPILLQAHPLGPGAPPNVQHVHRGLILKTKRR